MKRDDDSDWRPELVRSAAEIKEQRRLARNKRQRDRYAGKFEERRVHQKANYVIVTHLTAPTPKPRLGRPRPKTSTKPGPHLIRITAGAWRRALVYMLTHRGLTEPRAISARLGIDPTSVAQSICELKRLGALPSHFGRTPIRAKA